MMKKLVIMFLVLLSLGGNAFAAGDLAVTGNATVNGTINVGSGGVKFPDGTTQTTAKSPTTQYNGYNSRVIGTVYQNTTGAPMFVNVSLYSDATTTFTAYTDNSNPPWTTVNSIYSQAGVNGSITLSFWVLPGSYYRVVVSNGTPRFFSWTEWY